MACLVHHVEPITSMENLDYFVWRTDRRTDGHPDSPIPKCPPKSEVAVTNLNSYFYQNALKIFNARMNGRFPLRRDEEFKLELSGWLAKPNVRECGPGRGRQPHESLDFFASEIIGLSIRVKAGLATGFLEIPSLSFSFDDQVAQDKTKKSPKIIFYP
jgi:hypothetical protein